MRKQGRETLRRLLEAAIATFDERGYHRTRVDDIVKAAKTSHGTFYLYFRNKQDLFLALVSDVTEEMRLLADSLPPVRPSRAGYEELRAWLESFYSIYEHYHPVIRAWTEANAQDPEMAALGARVLRRFVDQLTRRVREADRPLPGDPGLAALAMVSMLERVSFYSVVGMVQVDRQALIDTLASILHAGLFGGARPRATKAGADQFDPGQKRSRPEAMKRRRSSSSSAGPKLT